jgi:hypothetical protein
LYIPALWWFLGNYHAAAKSARLTWRFRVYQPVVRMRFGVPVLPLVLHPCLRQAGTVKPARCGYRIRRRQVLVVFHRPRDNSFGKVSSIPGTINMITDLLNRQGLA